MQPNTSRRVHSLELKKAVIEACAQPGASVSAVALAHGLNANLVRKWLVGRGLKRAGLVLGGPALPLRDGQAPPSMLPMRFMPVALHGADANEAPRGTTSATAADIQIELRKGSALMTVRWPSSQAGACAGWLGELAGVVLK